MALGHFGVGSVDFERHQQIQEWKGDLSFLDQLVQDILSSKRYGSGIHEGQLLKEIPFLCLCQLTCAESTESKSRSTESWIAAAGPGAKALPSHVVGKEKPSARLPFSSSSGRQATSDSNRLGGVDRVHPHAVWAHLAP